jgi:hypothetical protein
MTEGLSELKAMEAAYSAFQPLTPNAQRRAAQWLLSALGLLDGQDALEVPSPARVLVSGDQDHNGNSAQAITSNLSTVGAMDIQGTGSANLTPKQFIAQKRPQVIAERIACLAFYLTHNRQTPTFRPSDIEALNTEAACSSINSSRDVDNARRRGYLVPAGDGKKQITSLCEDFVNALPDRAAIKEIRSVHPAPKKRRPSGSSKKSEAADGDN